MKQFTMELSESVQRPVVKLSDWHQFNVMLDTGALFPVWVDEEGILDDLGAKCIDDAVSFSGFGGGVRGRLYKLPYFKFGELIYPGFPVVAHKLEVPCHMLLSATMFSHLRYEIDDENHKFNVTIPDKQSFVRNLTIENKEGHLQVFCESAPEETSI